MKRSVFFLLILFISLSSFAVLSRMHIRNRQAQWRSDLEEAQPVVPPTPYYQMRSKPQPEARVAAAERTHVGEQFQIAELDEVTIAKQLQQPSKQAEKKRQPLHVEIHQPDPRPAREFKSRNSQRRVSREESYAIQLIASSDRRSVEDLLRQFHLRARVHIVEEMRYGQPWYVALYGQYSDKPAARRAIAKLPKRLRANRPWVRESKRSVV